MKHFYLKSIFAILVAAVALLVGIKLVYPNRINSEDEREIRNLTTLLANENVHVSSELISLDDHTVYEYTMKSDINASYLAKQFLGKSAELIAENSYAGNDGTFTVSGTHINYTPSEPKFSADTKSITLANAHSAAERICNEYGIGGSSCRTEVSGSKDKISVSVIQSIDKLPIFNNALVLELNESGLHSLSGVSFEPESTAQNGRAAKSISDALTEFMRECTDKKRETTITDVRLGYLLENPDAEETVLKPVWRIIVENSAVYYIDA
jgi:hypothetical protein